MNAYLTIAIDGPAASGKSSAAKQLALKLNIPYINTGNMYRAVTLYALRHSLSVHALIAHLPQINLVYRPDPQNGLYELWMNGVRCGADIRTPEVAREVSSIASVPEVRAWLVAQQRDLASAGSVIMEGRDIGTVVLPHAQFKFYLTASPLVRAQRRLAQDGEAVANATVESVAAEIAARDAMDSQRTVAPLRKAEDAILIDSSTLSLDQVVETIVSVILSKQ